MRLSQHSSPVPSASNHYFYIPVTPTSFRCQDHHQKPLNSSSPLKYASASPMTYRPGAEFTCKKSHLYLVELCVLQDTQSIQEHFMLIRLPRCCTYLCSTLLCGCTSLALHLISVHHTAQPYQFYGPSSLYCWCYRPYYLPSSLSDSPLFVTKKWKRIIHMSRQLYGRHAGGTGSLLEIFQSSKEGSQSAVLNLILCGKVWQTGGSWLIQRI